MLVSRVDVARASGTSRRRVAAGFGRGRGRETSDEDRIPQVVRVLDEIQAELVAQEVSVGAVGITVLHADGGDVRVELVGSVSSGGLLHGEIESVLDGRAVGLKVPRVEANVVTEAGVGLKGKPRVKSGNCRKDCQY